VLASARNNVWDVTTASANAGRFVFTGQLFQHGARAGRHQLPTTSASTPAQPGSPLLTDVLAGAPVTTAYRGA
jgi:hypothetical protein